jgi:hypothetical protein
MIPTSNVSSIYEIPFGREGTLHLMGEMPNANLGEVTVMFAIVTTALKDVVENPGAVQILKEAIRQELHGSCSFVVIGKDEVETKSLVIFTYAYEGLFVVNPQMTLEHVRRILMGGSDPIMSPFARATAFAESAKKTAALAADSEL